MRLPRTIRLDPSDTFVFERAAEPGEWAISGSFLFLDADADSLSVKMRHALRSGFLGISSLGFSTLAVVSEASKSECEAAIGMLAKAFETKLGAPDAAAALEAAAEEIAFARSLCDHEPGTLIAVTRSFDESGELREKFRTLKPRQANADQDSLHAYTRAFAFHEVDDENPGTEEQVDLIALTKDKKP